MNTILLVAVCLLTHPPEARPQPGIEGAWAFQKDKSTDIVPWRSWVPRVEISTSGECVTITHKWLERNQVAYTDSFTFQAGGGSTTIPVRSEIWTDNWFLGVLARPGSSLSVTGSWLTPGKALKVTTDQIVRTSQGETTLTTTREYRTDDTGTTLTLTERRASRPSPVILIFQRPAAP